MSEEAAGKLGLGQRDGLPEHVSILRSLYPRSSWRSHANFGQLGNFWLQVHESLRSQGGEVSRITDAFRERKIDAEQLQGMFVPRVNGFLQHLDHHHQIEDHAYFPKFRALDPRLVAGFDLLEADHELIHEGLSTMVEHARAFVAELRNPASRADRAADVFAASTETLLRLVRQHLADEEELVIPAMLKHGERALS